MLGGREDMGEGGFQAERNEHGEILEVGESARRRTVAENLECRKNPLVPEMDAHADQGMRDQPDERSRPLGHGEWLRGSPLPVEVGRQHPVCGEHKDQYDGTEL